MPVDDDQLLQRILDTNDVLSLGKADLHAQLAAHINNLILNNFEGLINLLYRVDVSEQKLKTLLKENDRADAGEMIASLVIERQVQKIRSRREHGRDDNIMNEEEKW